MDQVVARHAELPDDIADPLFRAELGFLSTDQQLARDQR